MRRAIRWVLLGVVVAGLAAGAMPLWNKLGVEFRLVKVRSLLRKAQPRDAIPLLEWVAQRVPDRAEVHYLLAVANRRAGRLDRVMEPLEKASQLGWPPKDLHRQYLLLLFQGGNFADSEMQLRDMLLRQNLPNDVAEEIYEALVKGYLSEMRAEEAVVCLDHWIRWRPANIEARLLRAELLGMTQEYDQEFAEYRDVLAIDPNHVEARMRLARSLMRASQVREARDHFRRCHELEPDNGQVLLGLAECEMRLGDLEAATKYLTYAERLDLPNDVATIVHSMRGQILVRQQKYEEALKPLKQALAASPNNSDALYAMGQCLIRLGRKQEAQAYLERSRQTTLDAGRMQDLLVEILTDPTNPDLRFRIAKQLLAVGMEDEAKTMLLTVLRYNRRHEGAHQMLAEYYEKKGNRQQAEKHRRALQELKEAARSQPPQETLAPLKAEQPSSASAAEGAPVP
jgi:tetratricopeptide (TPR) repeat protein